MRIIGYTREETITDPRTPGEFSSVAFCWKTRHTLAEDGGATVTLSFDDREFDLVRAESYLDEIGLAG